ncbi:hypothetical protein M3182_06065 [Mesobacillus maritimus]|uniref:hypothetical protein n=1 Tax=Mesobacillus maritimus TaxID=1643336 RepID=UPI002040170D|nr:hypothetical protein [Mesobacillus maritimus]MCM3585308.1 hypothetical protein [Mesobacillus maritimus]MCM3668195.1 hypothetical protein [Mesobacillus maritimus]
MHSHYKRQTYYPQRPYYCYPPYPQPHYRQYPDVDDTVFIQSVESFQGIAKDAITILNRLSNRKFAHQLMTLAQQGKQQEVDQLMKSIGVNAPIKTSFTPSGLKIEIDALSQGSPCCNLSMYLKWGD